MSSDPSGEALIALSHFLVAESSMGDTLLRVSEITTRALPNAEMAGIALLGEDGRPTTGVFTDEQAPEIDSAQYESGNGPCLDAWRHGRVVRLDDMESGAEQYPEFAQAAQAHGVESSLSLPLVAGGRGMGALNMYARKPQGFTEDDEAIGLTLAAAAAIVLANANAYWETSQLSEQLTEAMRSRAVIEQAKGILMGRSPELGPDEAFDVLRRASQRENVKLREIAQRMVERRPGSTDDEPPR